MAAVTEGEIKRLQLEELYIKYEQLDETRMFVNKFKTNICRSTNIDMLVNLLYLKNLKVHNYPIDLHIAHQNRIIAILDRNFGPSSYRAFRHLNDRTREYEGRYNLCGLTGFMSSLLINCQYILYNYFISHNVEVNSYDDSLVLFIKFFHIRSELMPDVEKMAVKNIFRQFRLKCPQCPLLNSGWYDLFIAQYRTWYDAIITKEWYVSKFGTRYDFSTIIENYGKGYFAQFINRDKTYYEKKNVETILFDLSWEYAPVYYDPNYNPEVNPEFIIRIRDFLIGDMMVFNKYLKYKQKYLQLKNKN